MIAKSSFSILLYTLRLYGKISRFFTSVSEFVVMSYMYIAVCITYNVSRMVHLITHRPIVTCLGDRKYHIRFFAGSTECNLVIRRSATPPSYYHAVDQDGIDVFDKVVKYMNISLVKPTPELVGCEEIKMYDMFDVSTVFGEFDLLEI